MFGFNTRFMQRLKTFNELNALRKNQLLAFYDQLRHVVGLRYSGTNKCVRQPGRLP